MVMLGERVRSLRKARDWTLNQLAERVGVSVGMISHIERGAKDPSLDTIERIAEAFSISPGLLLDPSLDLDRLRRVSHLFSKLDRLQDDQLELVARLIDQMSTPPQG